jgi:hypothetical protein
MGRTKLTKSEKTALLVVIRKELQVLLEELETGLPDYDQATDLIMENLSYILKEGLKTDPEDSNIYEIFDKK